MPDVICAGGHYAVHVAVVCWNAQLTVNRQFTRGVPFPFRLTMARPLDFN